MIVKILGSGAGFNGVDYNTEKIDKGKGELMLVKNFDFLDGLKNLRPEDYKNYLQMISSKNQKIVNPQFHAAISCKGKEYSKEQLMEIGEQWLDEMGYGKNPFLIIYHKDTNNNHVHLVSTRIDKNGKKIDSNYEKIRAIKAINKIIGLDENVKVSADIKKCFAFNFKSTSQFSLLIEKMGYNVSSIDRKINVMKYGRVLTSISQEELNSVIELAESDKKRIAQLRAIIEKYKLDYSTTIQKTFIALPSGYLKENGYTSDLAEHLKSKLGLEFVFHSKDNKTPYGFTIIDYAKKNVFKGGEIIRLKELIENNIPTEKQQRVKKDPYKSHMAHRVTSPDELAYYKTLVHSIINSYGLLEEGLKHQGFDLIKKSNELFIIDISSEASIKLNDLIIDRSEDYTRFSELNEQRYRSGNLESFESPIVSYDFANIGFDGNDIDDEATLGKNRAKKGMVRTDSR
jgi:hypothetical protein